MSKQKLTTLKVIAWEVWTAVSDTGRVYSQWLPVTFILDDDEFPPDTYEGERLITEDYTNGRLPRHPSDSKGSTKQRLVAVVPAHDTWLVVCRECEHDHIIAYATSAVTARCVDECWYCLAQVTKAEEVEEL